MAEENLSQLGLLVETVDDYFILRFNHIFAWEYTLYSICKTVDVSQSFLLRML